MDSFYVEGLGDAMSSVVGVSLGSSLVFPLDGWKPIFPEMHSRKGRYYDLTTGVDFCIHPQQKKGNGCSGKLILDWMKQEDALDRALTLYDYEAIRKKDPSLILDCPLGRKNWVFWGSASTWVDDSRIAVPYQCMRGGMIVQDWKYINGEFDFSYLSLLFKH